MPILRESLRQNYGLSNEEDLVDEYKKGRKKAKIRW